MLADYLESCGIEKYTSPLENQSNQFKSDASDSDDEKKKNFEWIIEKPGDARLLFLCDIEYKIQLKEIVITIKQMTEFYRYLAQLRCLEKVTIEVNDNYILNSLTEN